MVRLEMRSVFLGGDPACEADMVNALLWLNLFFNPLA